MCSPATVRRSDSSPLRRMSVGPLQGLVARRWVTMQSHDCHVHDMVLTWFASRWSCWRCCRQGHDYYSRCHPVPHCHWGIPLSYSHQHLQPGVWSFLCTCACMCVCMCRREKRKYIRTIQAVLLASLASDAAPRLRPLQLLPNCIHFSYCSDCVHFSCCSYCVCSSYCSPIQLLLRLCPLQLPLLDCDLAQVASTKYTEFEGRTSLPPSILFLLFAHNSRTRK